MGLLQEENAVTLLSQCITSSVSNACTLTYYASILTELSTKVNAEAELVYSGERDQNNATTGEGTHSMFSM